MITVDDQSVIHFELNMSAHAHTHMHKHVHTYANIGKIVDIVNKMVTNLATQQMAAEGSLITYSLNNKSNTKLSTISIQYNINI